MTTNNNYKLIAEKVFNWMLEEAFQGYDPYDGCNTRFAALTRYKSIRLALTYFNKFSPLNIRPILGVEKRPNIYASALAASSLLRLSREPSAQDTARRLISDIISKSLITTQGYHCWSGNGMFIQTTGGYSGPDVPGIVGTEQCVAAILDWLRMNPTSDDLLEIIGSARDFCLEVLLENQLEGPFFRYKPTTPPHMLTFNASMRAASLVAEVNDFLGTDTGNDVARESIHYLIGFQQPSGAWNYSIDLRTGKQKEQIDFHQGFMVDGLMTYLRVFGEDPAVSASLEKGLAFYRDVQFMDTGQCYYRYPKKWPVNIHNQAQGIITFVRAERFFPGSIDFAGRIADWTIENMFDGRECFYYLKYPIFTNKIPYFRWSQAWMLYALTLLQQTIDAQDGSSVSDVVEGELHRASIVSGS